jgi:deoxyribodipyrimidine photo-lyase
VTIFTVGKKLPWSTDREKFEAWAEGRTGVPFVDANMRELKVNHFSFF